MKISIILSFRNEAENIPILVERLKTALTNYDDHELIFVDDSSIDHSLKILTSLALDNNKIKIIKMSRRFGVTPCVIAGMKHASGDALIYMDSDLQDPPEIIPLMIEKYVAGADVVHTVRTKRYGESKFKLFLTKNAYSVINLFSEISLLKNSGDFKLLSRRVVTELLKIDDFDPYLRGLSVWVGFNQTFIEYQREPRFAGSTKFPLLMSLNPYKEFIRGLTSFSLAPLYFALILGFFISAISFISLVWVVATKLFGLNLPGWSAVMAIISLTSGISLFTAGIMGIYVGKIYQQVLNRPKFIIENTIGF